MLKSTFTEDRERVYEASMNLHENLWKPAINPAKVLPKLDKDLRRSANRA
jgi:hypothetical protein